MKTDYARRELTSLLTKLPSSDDDADNGQFIRKMASIIDGATGCNLEKLIQQNIALANRVAELQAIVRYESTLASKAIGERNKIQLSLENLLGSFEIETESKK